MSKTEILAIFAAHRRYRHIKTLDDAEVAILAEWEDLHGRDAAIMCGILDDHANGDDIQEGIEERRYWASPAGRRHEAEEAFESGRPMSSSDY